MPGEGIRKKGKILKGMSKECTEYIYKYEQPKLTYGDRNQKEGRMALGRGRT